MASETLYTRSTSSYMNRFGSEHGVKGRSSSLFFFILILICYQRHSVEGYKDGLYSTDTDFVKPLNADTFEAEVINGRQSVIWIVEFYNSWCGHCIHFAPTWKQLAQEMKGWSDMVVIAAIDCSQAVNIKPCRQFDIKAYPTMKMFPPVGSTDRLKRLAPIDTQSLPQIKSLILNFMTEFAPDTWPHLKHLQKIEDLWLEKDVHSSQLFIIFEEEKSEVGRQVVLDLRNVTGIKVRTMLKDQVAKFGITEYPSLYRINPDSTYSKLAVGKNSPELDRQMFVKRITEEVKSNPVGAQKVGLDNAQQKHPSTKYRSGGSMEGSHLKGHSLGPNKTQVNMQDLESALHYSLRQEIAICLTMDGERLDALKNYITVLTKYFPGRETVQFYLAEVRKMLLSLDSHSLTGEEWIDKLDSLQTESHYLPEVIKWASCKGSSPQYRGFPCSMWTLFHVLTVGAHVHQKGRTTSNPKEVLLAIRGYMKHFFGCEECSKHFLEISKSVESEVTSHTKSILWLWRTHNQVNQRLHGDESEDPNFPKIQFPPGALCPTCKSTDSLEWNEEGVLSFLISFYSEAGIFIPEDLQIFEKESADNRNSFPSRNKDKELDWWEKKQRESDLKQVYELRLRKRTRKSLADKASLDLPNNQLGGNKEEVVKSPVKGGKMRALWGLTDLDVSMCVVFYVISTVIILLLYHHFIVRRHMNPCKNIKSKLLVM